MERVIRREEAQLEDGAVLSPPWLAQPYRGATVVQAFGFVAHADVQLEVDGALLPAEVPGYPMPHGGILRLPGALDAGQQIRVRQRDPGSGLTSDWSAAVAARDYREDYPAGLPRPELFNQDGAHIGVGNLLPGGNVWITQEGQEVGRVTGCAEPQGVAVDQSSGHTKPIRAWFELCGDRSPPSELQITEAVSAPLAAPGFGAVYETGTQLVVTNVANGAQVTLFRGDSPVGTFHCWGGTLSIHGLAPFTATDVFSAIQELRPGSGSPAGTTAVLPCSALPAPTVAPIQPGDRSITVVDFVSDAIIRIWVNRLPAGAGGGPTVGLNRPLSMGDVVVVAQELPDGCRAGVLREITVDGVNPPVGMDPGALNLFPVGFLDYAEGPVKGSVFYPAQDDGERASFNTRLAERGRTPIVFLVHGNHYYGHESFRGYDYLQRALARMGMIVASVNCNKLNSGSSGTSGDYANIEGRAKLIIEAIHLFQRLDTDPKSLFHHKIDFGRVGLFGHSRGAEAVVLVSEVLRLPTVTVSGVFALAPTDHLRWESLGEHRIRGCALCVLLPAADGDVPRNDGAKFYDQCVPSSFKSQLYVHFANHNYFNQEWIYDDSRKLCKSEPDVMERTDHERILTAYGSAFFRAVLLGHTDMLAFLSGHRRPGKVPHTNVHLSFAWEDALVVDHHDDGNGIAVNTMGRPTTNLGGLTADEFTLAQPQFPLPLNPPEFNESFQSFHGRTVGMVVPGGVPGREFRTELDRPRDLTGQEVWIRAAEVYAGQHLLDATRFALGVEDVAGSVAWMDSDLVGGLARPYFHCPSKTKTMLTTLRFPTRFFKVIDRAIDLSRIVALRLRMDHSDERSLAFDDLHIVKEVTA